MSVLINFKICDNAEECNGIVSCPTGALAWDSANKTIMIDNDKCTSCGICEKVCEVHAIKVAKNDQEYEVIKKEIENDPRKVTDLYLDRYGAQPIIAAFLIDEGNFEQEVLKSSKMVAVEFFNEDSIECMLKSIPIRNLLDGIDINYKKVKLNTDNLLKKYQVKELPALLFFHQGKLIGKIEGYFEVIEIEKIKTEINLIVHK